MADGPYTEGWPRKVWMSKDEQDVQVVLLSDAERMREELETEKAISEGIADDRERMREALDGLAEAIARAGARGPDKLTWLDIKRKWRKADAALNPERGSPTAGPPGPNTVRMVKRPGH